MDQIAEAPERDVLVVDKKTGRPKRRRRFPYGMLLILLLAAGGGYWYWTHRGAQTQPEHHGGRRGGGEQPPQAVGVATVANGDVPILYDGLGTVTSLATVTVKTQINGYLTEVAFKEGQMVKKGDYLAQIDPRPYQVALEQAQGALVRDQASLANAQVDLARYQKLNSQDSIARQQLDTQKALVNQDEGTIQTDQAAIDTAKLNLVYAHITSPVDGRVGLRQVDAGNYVQTSDANGLVVIAQLQPISVIFTQPEDRIPAIEKRIKDGATLTVTVFDRAGVAQIGSGSVATIDNQIDTTTGTVKLRALFPNTDLALFPNQFVNVKLLLDTLKNAVVVPTAAIQVGQQGPYVYVVKDDDTVTVHQLKIGPAAGDKTAVMSGLSVGDKVVVDGIDRLREGAKVRIPGQAGTTGPGGREGGGAPAPTAGAPSTNGDGASPGGADRPGSGEGGGEQGDGQHHGGHHGGHHRHHQDGQPQGGEQPQEQNGAQ